MFQIGERMPSERALAEQERVLHQYEQQTQKENEQTLQQMHEELVKNRVLQEAQVQAARAGSGAPPA